MDLLLKVYVGQTEHTTGCALFSRLYNGPMALTHPEGGAPTILGSEQTKDTTIMFRV